MKVIMIVLSIFSAAILAFGIWFYLKKFTWRNYLPKRGAPWLIGTWILVAFVNYLAGFLNVFRLEFGLDLLLDLICYSEASFLALWVASMYIRVGKLYHGPWDFSTIKERSSTALRFQIACGTEEEVMEALDELMRRG